MSQNQMMTNSCLSPLPLKVCSKNSHQLYSSKIASLSVVIVNYQPIILSIVSSISPEKCINSLLNLYQINLSQIAFQSNKNTSPPLLTEKHPDSKRLSQF